MLYQYRLHLINRGAVMTFDFIGILCMTYLTEYIVESVELYAANKLALHPSVSTDVTFPREFLYLLNLPISV